MQLQMYLFREQHRCHVIVMKVKLMTNLLNGANRGGSTSESGLLGRNILIFRNRKNVPTH